ncbi:MAG: aminotransferase class V-fold PLP-dependent enzyme [Xanthomonadales bacterium]|nr:aminotransferase class V-fold PLP-dependent enzyme [Gammaproteobacteria bacterium]MBT8052970.1 aminotransferase class V-fold PLP-dependent enzyme [Gammaproteobacteria bacterium]NND57862.1 aminotransferase class V-fold PLP-dependent enzyme [Xanthomonadales bacterium]NNK50742.1 aminotransferase class V-fold PLP-dependent enzyme [Xanthomonadales bacterium]
MAELDLDFVRASFPAFSEPSLADFAHFENAGGSYASRHTIEWLERFYRQTKVQPYYDFEPSRIAGEQMDSAGQRMADWLNIGRDELHFGPSTSQNSYVIAQALRQELKPGDEVIVTNQDHEANIGAWSRLEDENIVVREWKIDPETAELHPMDLEALLSTRTRAVAFTHCSNVVGSINPVREITDLIHEAGAWAIVDGVSFCPHGMPDIPALGADIYMFSLYKVYGPHLGAMYIDRDLNAELPYQGHYFNALKPSARFTPAGPDHAQIAAVNGVMDYMDSVYQHHHDADVPPSARAAAVHELFRSQETMLLQPLLDYLAGHSAVRLIGKQRAALRAPTVAFTVEGRNSMELAARLGERGLGVGAGHFYAYRLVEALGYDPDDGVLRASFVHYTTSEEITRLIRTLDELI